MYIPGLQSLIACLSLMKWKFCNVVTIYVFFSVGNLSATKKGGKLLMALILIKNRCPFNDYQNCTISNLITGLIV